MHFTECVTPWFLPTVAMMLEDDISQEKEGASLGKDTLDQPSSPLPHPKTATSGPHQKTHSSNPFSCEK